MGAAQAPPPLSWPPPRHAQRATHACLHELSWQHLLACSARRKAR